MVRLRCALHVRLRDGHLVLKVRFVRKEFDWDVPRDLDHRRDPVLQVVQRLLSCDIADGRTPWAPWKYASFSNSRKPFSPIMSQIVMSTSMPPFGLSTLISFFETFAPRVEMYRSSNWS